MFVNMFMFLLYQLSSVFKVMTSFYIKSNIPAFLHSSFFIISPQYKNDNIANFVLALPLEMKKIIEDCNFKTHTSRNH